MMNKPLTDNDYKRVVREVVKPEVKDTTKGAK